jgi:hypothetical protein
MILTKIDRILRFEQRKWLAPWVDYCALARKNATSNYESELYKGLVCAVFGKTMENVRKRKNFSLVGDEIKLQNLHRMQHFKDVQ